MLSLDMLSLVILGVVMPSVVMLSVIMLSVLAPILQSDQWLADQFFLLTSMFYY